MRGDVKDFSELGYLGQIFVNWQKAGVLPWASLYEAPAGIAMALMRMAEEVNEQTVARPKPPAQSATVA